jgi:hypothetical protein
MTIAAPSMMPQAAAAGTLYVSAENAMFNNSFGGAQIIEVVIIDKQRDETDEIQGEPVVKVDENQLRMVQAVDGNWYAYFGDSTKVAAADGESTLDYGTDGTPTIGLGDFDEANNVYYKTATQPTSVVTNYPSLSNYNNTDSTNESDLHFGKGQIGVDPAQWPIIQLYDLTIEDFDVVYEQAGADEVVSLTWDTLEDYASLELDRNSASQESEIHLVITDNQLNIDPTAEDIVIFYVATDDEGVSWMNRTASTLSDTEYIPFDNTFDDNGKLIINNATSGAVITANDATLDDATADLLMIFYEGGENSGIFYNTDDDDDANLIVAKEAKRGFTATFDYNDSAQSFVVANDFGVIDMEEASVGDVWNSGEPLTVTLIDQDLNKNSGSDEDLLMKNTTRTHLIPSLQIGTPLMLTTNTTAAPATIVSVSDFSNIAYVDIPSGHFGTGGNGNNMTVPTGWTGTQVAATNDGDQETSYLNYDITSFTNATNDMAGICLVESTGRSIACDADADGRGIVQIKGTEGTTTSMMNVTASFTEAHGGDAVVSQAIVLDVFSFGPAINNAIY